VFNTVIQATTSVINFFYGITGSYGLAIIILTVAVRILIMPLYQRQLHSMRRMQLLQPKIKELKEKYKNDMTRFNQAQMDLYKEFKINPLSGCLPMLIQLPFLYAIYGSLLHFPYVGSSAFLWLANLSHPDPLFILPVLVLISTFWQAFSGSLGTGAATSRTQTLVMGVFIALLMGFWSTRFPAGLSIYWVMTSLFSVGQQYLTYHLQPAASEGVPLAIAAGAGSSRAKGAKAK
jgi:YidC/Oxa1 family membrane protein insertase